MLKAPCSGKQTIHPNTNDSTTQPPNDPTHLLCTTKIPSWVSALSLSRSVSSLTSSRERSMSFCSSRMMYLLSASSAGDNPDLSMPRSPVLCKTCPTDLTHWRVVRVSSTSSTMRIFRPRRPPWVRSVPSCNQHVCSDCSCTARVQSWRANSQWKSRAIAFASPRYRQSRRSGISAAKPYHLPTYHRGLNQRSRSRGSDTSG